jgi:hypothetical protein
MHIHDIYAESIEVAYDGSPLVAHSWRRCESVKSGLDR